MILQRQRLAEILTVLGTSVGNKVMKVADFVQFKFDTKRGKLMISSTDFNAFLTVDYGELALDEVDVPDVFLIQFNKLFAIVKASTTEDVIFKSKGKVIIVRTNGEYRFETWANAADFPAHSFVYEEIGRWPVPEIMSAWNKVSIAVSKDVTRIAYQGVNYDGSFAATDNRRLSVVRSSGDDAAEPMLLPLAFGNVLKHCKSVVSVGPTDGNKTLVMVCEEIGLIASVRLLDANFQDYKKVLGMYKPGVVVKMAKQPLLSAAARLMVFSDALYKVVKVSLLNVDSTLYLDLDITHEGGGNESIEVEETNVENVEVGKQFEYLYHVDNLIDAVTAVDDPEEVTLEFQDNGFLWIREGLFTHVLTPMVE